MRKRYGNGNRRLRLSGKIVSVEKLWEASVFLSLCASCDSRSNERFCIPGLCIMRAESGRKVPHRYYQMHLEMHSKTLRMAADQSLSRYAETTYQCVSTSFTRLFNV